MTPPPRPLLVLRQQRGAQSPTSTFTVPDLDWALLAAAAQRVMESVVVEARLGLDEQPRGAQLVMAARVACDEAGATWLIWVRPQGVGVAIRQRAFCQEGPITLLHPAIARDRLLAARTSPDFRYLGVVDLSPAHG